jgi:uncharacterized membrane protein YfcA
MTTTGHAPCTPVRRCRMSAGMVAHLDPAYVLLGFVVGTLVGLTGIGGGALLTPLLILAGVRPVIAVGTDLAFAAVTKIIGCSLHLRRGTADIALALSLASGGVPGAIVGSLVVDHLDLQGSADPLVTHLLGCALLLAATASLLRALGLTLEGRAERPSTLAAATLGLLIGIVVGMTSIGAGSLLMALFAVLYRLPAARAVGTDLVFGALLALVAATGHMAGSRVEFGMLAALLVGSTPGVLFGSWLCPLLPGRPLRIGIAAMLILAGFRLL